MMNPQPRGAVAVKYFLLDYTIFLFHHLKAARRPIYVKQMYISNKTESITSLQRGATVNHPGVFRLKSKHTRACLLHVHLQAGEVTRPVITE